MIKTETTVLGFNILVNKDDPESSLKKEHGKYHSEEMVDLTQEYFEDPKILETTEFFARFRKVLSECTRDSLRVYLLLQNANTSKEIVSFINDTLSIMGGSRYGKKRLIPIESYHDMIRYSNGGAGTHLNSESEELLKNYTNEDIIYLWITTPSLGLVDLFLSISLIFGVVDKKINNKEIYNGKRYQHDSV